jgi:hypothetical protein
MILQPQNASIMYKKVIVANKEINSNKEVIVNNLQILLNNFKSSKEERNLIIWNF